MTFQPVNIPGAVQEPPTFVINSWYYQAEQAKEFAALLPVNPIENTIEYDQKKDPSCVIFSAAGMLAHNAGLDFTYDELVEIWREYQGNSGGSIFKTTTQIGQRFMLEHFPVHTGSPEFEMILDRNWAMQISIWTDAQFFMDAVNNGIVNDIHKIPGPEFEIYKHAIIIYRRSGRTWLQNTWKKGATTNIYDITDVYKAMIENGLIRPCAMICVPFSQDRTAGMLMSLKWMTRALKRIGQDTTGDIWGKYKKHYAKVDGVIDEKYRIR